MRIITKKDVGKQIQVKLHEFFGVEVESSNPKNEYLAVPSFIKEQNYTIIKEYNYAADLTNKSDTQSIGKRIYLLMATKVSKVDLSWYNLMTAEEELYFMLNVSENDNINILFKNGHAISDTDISSMPNSSSRSDVVFGR